MKVLVIEDETKVAAFLKQGLEEQHYQVDVTHDGEKGKNLAIENNYDIILLDIILHHIDGIEICKEIRKQSNIPILMLTALGNTDDKVKGLESGADDYLVKPFQFKELLARIKALTRRNNNKSQTILSFADIEMHTNKKIVKRGDVSINLTVREFALLELFLRNTGKVLSRSDIAKYVWEISFDTGTNVIDVYVNYLRNKVDKNFSKKLIYTVIGMGYIMKEES